MTFLRKISRLLFFAVIACLLTVSSACSSGEPAKNGDGTVRTDTAPLTKRFGQLGQPVAVHWMSGTLGVSGIGPSTYWIDAVVEVTPVVMASLRAKGDGTAASLPTSLSRGLKGFVPSGSWHRGPHLGDTTAEGVWDTDVYLLDDTNTVVILAKGDG